MPQKSLQKGSDEGLKATAGRAADRQRDEKDVNTGYDSRPWPERMDRHEHLCMW